MVSGTNLVMPGGVEESRRILSFIAEEISPDTHVNVMEQYRPVREAHDHVEIARPITAREYGEVHAHARALGLSLL